LEKTAQLQDEFIQEILDQTRNARLEIKAEKINFKEAIDQTSEQLKFSPPEGVIKK
jgi:hypothetical protein